MQSRPNSNRFRQIIIRHQTGFLEDRFIGENIKHLHVYDVMIYAEVNQILVLLMLLDFENFLGLLLTVDLFNFANSIKD